MRVGRRILNSALMAGSVFGLAAGGTVLAVASAPAAQAATTCSAAWSSSTVYTAGQQASENGIEYTADYWTEGNDPATNNGGTGSGQPWTSDGACTGGTSSGGGGGGTGGGGTGTGSTSGLLFSPYKDVTINMNWNTYQMQSAVTGSDLPVVGSGSVVSQYIPKLPALTVAFATGACGSETWGGVSGANWAAENVPQLEAADLNYVVFMARFPDPKPSPEQSPYFWGGVATNWPSWQFPTLIGLLLADTIPTEWGFGFAGILALLGLMYSLMTDRASWVAAGVASAAAVAAVALPLKLNIVVAIAAAVAAGLLMDHVTPVDAKPVEDKT